MNLADTICINNEWRIGMDKSPDYVVKRKKLNKVKNAFIFTRNNLNFEQFKKTTEGYEFNESFVHKGVHCEFKTLVHSNDMYSIFSIDKKHLE